MHIVLDGSRTEGLSNLEFDYGNPSPLFASTLSLFAEEYKLFGGEAFNPHNVSLQTVDVRIDGRAVSCFIAPSMLMAPTLLVVEVRDTEAAILALRAVDAQGNMWVRTTEFLVINDGYMPEDEDAQKEYEDQAVRQLYAFLAYASWTRL